MRAMDCIHDDHEEMHFTGADDEELAAKIRAHRDEFHPEISDDQVTELIAANAYDE